MDTLDSRTASITTSVDGYIAGPNDGTGKGRTVHRIQPNRREEVTE